MNCDNVRSCCSPYSQLAQQLEETTNRAIAAYNLAAQAFATVIPPQGGRNIDVTLVSGPAYEVSLKNPMDEDVVINADLTVNGDIYQNGSAYESHAEQLYTTKDTVIMRDGAVTGLGTGEVAGLIMKKYDGVNDGALVVSSDGTARVGDVGSEQPLMTRDESADMTDGAILEWDAANNKAVTSGKAVSDLVTGSGNIGSDTKPVKVVNGVATEVTDALQKDVGIKWIELHTYTLPANTLNAHSNTSVNFVLSHTISDNAKVGFIPMDYLGPGPYQTYAHYLYAIANNSMITVQIWNEGDGAQNGQWLIRFIFFELA